MITIIEDVEKRPEAEQDQARTDYGYLPDLVGHLVGLVHVQATNLCGQHLEALNLTAKQAVALHFISRNSDTMQKDLAAGVGTSPTVMVSILDTLEARGLIRRVPSTTDRRALSATLTEAGKEALPLVKQAFYRTEARLDEEAGLSKAEREQLLHLLRKVADREVAR